jgi:hypothetical protein
MRAPKQNAQRELGAGNTKKQRGNSTSAKAQSARLLSALQKSSVSTIRARRSLDLIHPAGRVRELRNLGHEILMRWVWRQTECGEWHRVGLYTLKRSRKG